MYAMTPPICLELLTCNLFRASDWNLGGASLNEGVDRTAPAASLWGPCSCP